MGLEPKMLACSIASVVSDSLWPHGPQPASLLCPWDSPGKNTGVACRALLPEDIHYELFYCSQEGITLKWVDMLHYIFLYNIKFNYIAFNSCVHPTTGFLSIFWVTRTRASLFSSFFFFPFLLLLFFLFPLSSQINSSGLSLACRFTKLSPLELKDAVAVLLSMSFWPWIHLHR